ncbi:MAG: TetR/AcrR family transcriptional regulator [Cyanobacteria bacterium P01_D01_bin.105]
MARTRKISDEQILEAALAVFLEQGFGASTLDIAKRAGISEASIFKRFSTKENLFFKAMGLPSSPPWITLIETMAGKGDLKENLKRIGSEAIAFSQENFPKLIMLMSKGVLFSKGCASKSPIPPLRNLKALTRFFEIEISLGRMKAKDPQATAMLFIGGCMNYIILSKMSAPLPEPDVYVDHIIEGFWEGIKPDG